jgi:hypothetical protein
MADRPAHEERAPDAFLIDERLDAAGAPHRTALRPRADGELDVEEDGQRLGALSALALRTVMRRYGRPLDDDVQVTGPALQLGDERLRRMRWRAAVDAIGRDYLVWEDASGAVAALAVSVTAALRHLATARRS